MDDDNRLHTRLTRNRI